MARLYSQGEESIPIISTLIKGLLHKTLVTEKQTSTNIPELSFLLVFSLLHLVFLKLGSTMTISELIVALGRLQISSIKLEGEISLPVPINEELVTVKRVRRLSIKLAIYIGVQIDI